MIKISLSSTAKKIIPKLRKLYDNDEYVQGVIISAGNDDNLRNISRFIDYADSHDEEISSDDVAFLALSMAAKRDGRM